MISASQLRMARSALGWTLKELANKAKVHINTVSRCEAGYEVMTGTLQRIESVFRSEGVVFLEDDDVSGAGIRLKRGAALKGRGAPERVRKHHKSKTKPK